MKLSELEIDTASRKRSPDTEPDDLTLTLTRFSDDDDCDRALRELSEEILKAETAVQARMILALFFPDLNWGGTRV